MSGSKTKKLRVEFEETQNLRHVFRDRAYKSKWRKFKKENK